MMGIISYYAAKQMEKNTNINFKETEIFKIGQIAIKKAYENAPNINEKELMKNNSKFYDINIE